MVRINYRGESSMKSKLCIITLLCILTSCILTGCKVKLFKEQTDEYHMDELSKSDLEENTYYIKNGTKFTPVLLPAANKTGIRSLDTSKCLWLGAERSKLPIYYKGETICYNSESVAELTNIAIERFKDMKYTIGITGAYFDDGYICINPSYNLIQGTDAFNKMNTKARIIRIESINGKTVTEDMLNAAGNIIGFEDGKEYEIIYYQGTTYGKSKVKADLWLFQEFEYTIIDKSQPTPNGYLSFKLPEDSKSGYYMVNGAGLFKYYDHEKSADDETTNMNEPYFQSQEEQLKVYSQQYTFTLDTNKSNVVVEMKYNPDSLEDKENIKALLTGPNGCEYELSRAENENGTYTCKIATAICGKWILNVIPKTLEINSVNVNTQNDEQEKTEELFDFVLTEDISNIQFKATYTGVGEVNGILTDDNGYTYNFIQKKPEDGFITCDIAYLKAGHYKVSIYHNTDTSIIDVNYDEAGINDTKTIVIEE